MNEKNSLEFSEIIPKLPRITDIRTEAADFPRNELNFSGLLKLVEELLGHCIND
jgi:hypothetical protein